MRNLGNISDVDKNIDAIPNNEESTVFDIEISEYDISKERFSLEEDLDEKTVGLIEREIRSSYEYSKYTKYLREELNLTKCSLLEGIDCSDGAAKLEFHHYPMNLYEITEAVGKKMIDELQDDEAVSSFDIAEKVMEEHFKGNIGIVPLTKTLHDMAHNRSIIIPMKKVNGNYNKFLRDYSKYISDDIKDRINDAKINNDSEEAQNYNKIKLEKNISKYNINYIDKNSDEEDENDEE